MAPDTGRVHELALTEDVVKMVAERLGSRRVARVRLAVGRWMAVSPEAMQFCFDACTRGTTLDGARLEIEEVPARLRCRSCGQESEPEDGLPLCACGSADVAVTAGHELKITELEVF